jgi:hypothetical protein
MKPRRLLPVGEGRAPYVGLRFTYDDLAMIDATAEERQTSRSGLIRELVLAGLQREATAAAF